MSIFQTSDSQIFKNQRTHLSQRHQIPKHLPLHLKLPQIRNPRSDRILDTEASEQFRDKFSIYSKPKNKMRNSKAQNFKTEVGSQSQRRVEILITEPESSVFFREKKVSATEVFSLPKDRSFGNSCSISRKVKQLLNIKMSALHSISSKINTRSLKKLGKSPSDQFASGDKKDTNRLQTQREQIRLSRSEKQQIRWLIRQDIIKQSSCRQETSFNDDLVGEKKDIIEFKKHKKVELGRKKYSRRKRIADPSIEKHGKQNSKGRENRRGESRIEIAAWEIEEI